MCLVMLSKEAQKKKPSSQTPNVTWWLKTKLQTHPKGFGLCVSKECSWQRLFFLLLGMESIMLFNFDLQQEKSTH